MTRLVPLSVPETDRDRGLGCSGHWGASGLQGLSQRVVRGLLTQEVGSGTPQWGAPDEGPEGLAEQVGTCRVR